MLAAAITVDMRANPGPGGTPRVRSVVKLVTLRTDGAPPDAEPAVTPPHAGT